MSYPVGTIAITEISDEYSDQIPVWIKTVNGWFFVTAYDASYGFMGDVSDEDFGEDWLFIEPETQGE